MIRRTSLRVRLFAVIISPLVLMAVLLGFWRFSEAQKTAEDLFDRSLLSAALAISRDVAVSGGDALSRSTRDLIRDASGGEVFYHATGPDGLYVTGYAYPPAVATSGDNTAPAPQFAQSVYRGENVRVLRVTERVTIEGLSGNAVVTVWQRLSDRQQFARELAIRAVALIGALLATLAFVVWFGVALGLRPLLDLQEAIELRSPHDLSQIKRPVPVEVQGILNRLNRLFGQVEHSIHAHQTFISDAAHQLRNPAAAVQSMAESLGDAVDETDRQERISDLITAARGSARIAEQLLSLDRLRQTDIAQGFDDIELTAFIRDICADIGPSVLSKGVDFGLTAPLKEQGEEIHIRGDRLFLTETVKNLIDNALRHGGSALSAIHVTVGIRDGLATVTVADDGKGLRPDQANRAFSRFSQLEPSSGSGLGLAIAESVATQHAGRLDIDDVASGASLTLSLPIAGS